MRASAKFCKELSEEYFISAKGLRATVMSQKFRMLFGLYADSITSFFNSNSLFVLCFHFRGQRDIKIIANKKLEPSEKFN